MKSIMHDKDSGTCYLCMLLHSDRSIKNPRHEHHAIFGTANRRLSEKYGLKVYLCLDHHENGPEAVHRNKETALLIKINAQTAFESRWPELNFREIFGKNYLEEGYRQQTLDRSNGPGKGFCFISNGIDSLDWTECQQEGVCNGPSQER